MEPFFLNGQLVSYLYSSRENRDLWKRHDPVRGHNLYWELLLGAPEGTLLGFYPDGCGGCRCRFKDPPVHTEAVSYTHLYYFSPEGNLKEKVHFNNCLFEAVYTAPHGMTLGYRDIGTAFVPLYGEISAARKVLDVYKRQLQAHFHDPSLHPAPVKPIAADSIPNSRDVLVNRPHFGQGFEHHFMIFVLVEFSHRNEEKIVLPNPQFFPPVQALLLR